MANQTTATTADSVRVSVWHGAAGVDVTLPARVPVAALIPSLFELTAAAGGPPAATPTHLRPPGAAALDPEQCLAESGVGDGAVLLLEADPPPPGPTALEAADRIAEQQAGAQRCWDTPAGRVTAGLAAVWAGALIGYLGVPGGWGDPARVLLSGVAGVTAAVMAFRSAPMLFLGVAAVFGALATGALVAAAAALPGSGAAAVALLAAAALLAGAAPAALRFGALEDAGRRLTALGSGAAVAVGVAALWVTAGPGWAPVALSAAAATMLALRVPSESDVMRRASLLIGAVGAGSAAAIGLARHGATVWAGGGVLAAAAALGLLARPAGSPRAAPAFAAAALLAALVPLTAWVAVGPGWPR
ncbi:EsaB/YukD family protein [Mycolicibacterium brumae]|uniref:Type VII secretion integral membrane protein EccD n=3 Tax=Mycolicibacterium brumae TaxID=85968 RepID=A0A2G5PH90_9MYCO|nr:EsaB/YukD family protein [Mycolicibacterium brumae]PIB77677.1 hypothetical protein CQY22_001670 [Mycolicibacterium brumae]